MLRSIIAVIAFLTCLSSTVAMADTFRIGVLVPLSGDKAEKGVPIKNAVALFAERFNDQATGSKLELVVKDDFDDPDKARAAAIELVKDPSLLAVVGHYYPDAAMATAKVFSDAHVPFISPNVSNPEVFRGNPWAFTANIPDDAQGAFIATYIKEVLKKDNVLVVHTTDPFGVALKEAFLAKAGRIGLKVLKEQGVDKNATLAKDWAATAFPDKAANAQIGVVAALTHSEVGLQFLPQLRDIGIATPVMAANTWSNPRILKELNEKVTNDVYLTSAFLWEIANQKASHFATAYAKKFGDRPSIAAAMAYDSMELLSGAMASSTKPTRESIRNHLAGIDWHHFVEGVTGNLFFKNGRAMSAEWVDKYLHDNGQPPAPPPIRDLTVQAAERDIFVAMIRDGRFKVASVQLVQPHEAYVLKELGERIGKGQLLLVDGEPFHVVDAVFVGVDIIRINDVNIKDMLWDADMFMWFKWGGPRLDPKDIEKITAVNAVKEQATLLKEDLSHATKYRAYRKRLTLGVSFDLSSFPFDSQVLPLQIAHANKNSTHIMLVPDTRHMETGPVTDVKPQEWTYIKRAVFSDLFRYESTFGDPDYRMGTGYKSPVYFSTVNLEIELKRMIKPYLFTFFLPLLIILGIILLVLWVPLDQFAPRINAAISGLIGVLVYHMSQKNSFPKVGYTMTADYYFLIAYAFVVAMIICIIITQTMMSAGQKDLAKGWNKKLSYGALIAVVCIYGVVTLLSVLT
ncbi:MAG: ABC transporter substrate-binding protein [Magnetococcales bacterium]|nr:ABC transporter substrate-binding protein [Magnetococcales bacterium]